MAFQIGEFRGFETELQDPGIAVFTFNQPERLNGLTQVIKRDLIEQLTQAQMDDRVRVLVFTGKGRAFCAGDDVTGRPLPPGPQLMPDIFPATAKPSAPMRAFASTARL
jgi:2-(1,2-epoxy-1,2-dihydrophenyl)acetyl-CoA isomerase